MKKYIKRDLKKEVLAGLKANYITAILGARQTGKTTLMGKLEEHFLQTGFSQERIFNFNFDDLLLRQKAGSDFYFIRNTI